MTVDQATTIGDCAGANGALLALQELKLDFQGIRLLASQIAGGGMTPGFTQIQHEAFLVGLVQGLSNLSARYQSSDPNLARQLSQLAAAIQNS